MGETGVKQAGYWGEDTGNIERHALMRGRFVDTAIRRAPDHPPGLVVQLTIEAARLAELEDRERRRKIAEGIAFISLMHEINFGS